MDVLVSIRCVTYNQEPFIRQCLEGFVMQKTNFRFEAIVHDDASTDGTATIILEYAEKYPDIIKPIIETENQYSKHDGSLGRIMNSHMYGKYVALCEGDDYWTDPYKLQKQVDFLESHPEYTLCFHNAMLHFEQGEKDDSLFLENMKSSGEFTGIDILKKWTIPTASVIYRKKVIESQLFMSASGNKGFLYGDIVLFLTNAELGKLYYINETMSVYRRHEGGISYGGDLSNKIKLITHYRTILKVFGSKYKKIVKNTNCCLYRELIGESLRCRMYKLTLMSTLNYFITSPSQCLGTIWRFCKKNR